MRVANLLLYLINLIFSIVESLIALRIILKLFAANPAAPFVSWVYETTQPLLVPFTGMFPSPVLSGGFIIEFSALFGLLVYGIIAYLISELVNEISWRSSRRTTYINTIEDDTEVVEERRVRRRR